jgi:hypothetical protein
LCRPCTRTLLSLEPLSERLQGALFASTQSDILAALLDLSLLLPQVFRLKSLPQGQALWYDATGGLATAALAAGAGSDPLALLAAGSGAPGSAGRPAAGALEQHKAAVVKLLSEGRLQVAQVQAAAAGSRPGKR